MIHIKAAGGVLMSNESERMENYILLIKRGGVWDLPKGKIEEGEPAELCAVREVEEETGAVSLEIVTHLCDTYHEYTDSGMQYGKTTAWYSMKATSQESLLHLSPQKEEGITDLKWVNPNEAMFMVHYDNLKNVVREFRKTHSL